MFSVEVSFGSSFFIFLLEYDVGDFPFGLDFWTFLSLIFLGHSLLEYPVGLYFLNCLCEMLGEVLLDFLLDFY